MAREPELSIKVKVDPQIKPTELKTSIERKVKQSGEKPQIDIDPNVDGIKKKVEDKLKNIKATASITPVVDTEKLKFNNKLMALAIFRKLLLVLTLMIFRVS